jgi:hypothetical protein
MGGNQSWFKGLLSAVQKRLKSKFSNTQKKKLPDEIFCFLLS